MHRRDRRTAGGAEVLRDPDPHARAVGRPGRRRAGRRRHRVARGRRPRVRGRRRRGVAVRPRDVAEYCGWSVNFAEKHGPRRRHRGRDGVASRGRHRARALRGGGVRDDRTAAPAPARSRGAARPEPGHGLRRVEHGVGFAPGRVRRALRQRGAELRLRDVRAALPRPLRLGRAGAGEDRGRSTRERVREPVGGLPRPADHARRRARVACDLGAAAPARDRDAVHGRRGVRGDHRRTRA